MKKHLVLLCAPVVALASGTAFAEKGDRAGWYIGGGIGNAAVATYKIGGTSYDYTDWTEDSVSPFVLHFKVGGTLAPKHLLGADIGLVMSISSSGDSDDGDDGDSSTCCDDWDYAATGSRRAARVSAANSELDASIVALHAMVAYTYYPRARGFFLRAGIGPASLTRELEGDTRVSTGHAELLGLGYSFWIGRRFNIGVNFDLEVQTYTGGDDNVDSSQLANLFVSADWY
jgi:hypothetical protein